MIAKEPLFKILFSQGDSIYEIYARQVSESDMYGFILVEELVFNDSSSTPIGPTEEKVKREFVDVTRTYIPMHAILRIDEVEQVGQGLLAQDEINTNNVTQFPSIIRNKRE